MKTFGLGYLLMLVLLSAVIITRHYEKQDAPLSAQVMPGGYDLAPFNLIQGNGGAFTNTSLQGKWTILTLGFTQCPDACPTAMAYFRGELNRMNEEEKAKSQFVIVSVDPERDTPEFLHKYVKGFHTNIMGATGSIEEVTKFAKSLHTHFHKEAPRGDNLYMLAHSPRYYMVDPTGRLYASYDPPLSGGQVFKDLKQLMAKEHDTWFSSL